MYFWGDLDSYLGQTIWKFYTFLGPNLGGQFLKYHYEDGNGTYFWQDGWHLGPLLLKYVPRISDDIQYCECKGLISSQWRKLKLAASRVCGFGSYSGQVFWGKPWSKCSRKCQFRTTKLGEFECGGHHGMLLDLLHQKFSNSGLPGILTNRLCSIPRRPDTCGA